jgi:hypothetical protein
MATITVQQGKRYRATITLGWLERWAGNETVAEKLRAAGFSEVSVSGSGGTRMAEALWAGPASTGVAARAVSRLNERGRGRAAPLCVRHMARKPPSTGTSMPVM